MPLSQKRQDQRRRFLLRLICANFAPLFADSPDTFSRVTVDGVDGFLRQLFLGAYDRLNEGAKLILDDLHGCQDADLWGRIFAERHKYHFAVTVLVRTLLYFGNLKRSRQAFVTRVNSIVGDRRFFFDMDKFNTLFAALYSDLFAKLEAEELEREFDVLFGDRTTKRIEMIKRAFSESTLSVESSTRKTSRTPAKGSRRNTKEAKHVRKATILAVDDDPDVLDIISEVLEGEGYQVSVARSMEAAEKLLDLKPTNLVILDIFMPGKGGIDGLHSIRRRHAATKIIAISGGWGEASAAQSTSAAKKLGADAVMQKPFKIGELVRQVRLAIGES